MTDTQKEWTRAKEQLVSAVTQLGFPQELGEQVAIQLGSPKAMHRMTVYLYNEKPRTAEIVVDEMLAICSEIEAWRSRKEAQEANVKYNELLFYGLVDEDDRERI